MSPVFASALGLGALSPTQKHATRDKTLVILNKLSERDTSKAAVEELYRLIKVILGEPAPWFPCALHHIIHCRAWRKMALLYLSAACVPQARSKRLWHARFTCAGSPLSLLCSLFMQAWCSYRSVHGSWACLPVLSALCKPSTCSSRCLERSLLT